MKQSEPQVKHHFLSVKNILNEDPFIEEIKILRENISSAEGFIQIHCKLLNGFIFNIFEYFSIENGVENYRYHLMNKENLIIGRWDNAPHHKEISTFPHHFNQQDG